MSSALLRLFRTSQPRIWQRRPCLQRGIRPSFLPHTDLSPEPPSLEELEHEEELAAQEEELAEAMETEAESAPSAEDQSAAPAEASYRLFMKDTAPGYKLASPQNWLGGGVPFPLNQSFIPPPPISDKQRNEMYRLYMLDPEKNSVRALSQTFHISLNRVDAILRLKGMEDAWAKEGNQLQTGFVRGMERLLGVAEFIADPSVAEDAMINEEELELRSDVHEADIMEEAEKNDPARQRYQRMYWESLSEFAGEATVPAALERSRRTAERLAAKAAQLKARKYLPIIPDTNTIKTPKEPVQISSKEGRPDIHFVDVGTKFLDVASETKRLGRIETRARFRTKKAAEKQQKLTV